MKYNNTKMITCNLKGGLGNQLFQIFAIIACAFENNTSFCFTNADNLGGNGCTLRYTFWNTFLKSLQIYTYPPYDPFFMIRDNYHKLIKNIGCSQFHYEPIPYTSSCHDKNIVYDGYFQSYKYFNKYQDRIYDLIQLNERKREVMIKYPELCSILFQQKENINSSKISISMHFRLGDYKHLGFFHPIMSIDYYKKSLSYILEKCKEIEPKKEIINILYFCEAEDNEYVKNLINELTEIYPLCAFHKVPDEIKDYEQMLLMSVCNHHIIANSSFSWFGAYFNQKTDKIVCYPSEWFCGHGKDINTKDLFPPEWVCIL